MNVALLITNVALVLVTGAYVFLTWRLATSAEASARHAKQAAESAALAVAIQRASLNVSFDIVMLPRPEHLRTAAGRSELEGVCLRSLGDAVWLHSIDVVAVATLLGGEPQWYPASGTQTLTSADAPSPWFMQAGESWTGALRTRGSRMELCGIPATNARSAVDGVRLAIAYSVDRDAQPARKVFEVLDQLD